MNPERSEPAEKQAA